MKRIIVIVIVLAILAVVGYFGYQQFLAPVEETPTPVQEVVSQVEVFLRFDSPINAGTINLSCDGEPLEPVSFDFTEERKLLADREGTGQVTATRMIPSGRHTIDVELIGAERGHLGSRSLTGNFKAGSRWSLRINLAPGSSRASFHLVPRR